MAASLLRVLRWRTFRATQIKFQSQSIASTSVSGTKKSDVNRKHQVAEDISSTDTSATQNESQVEAAIQHEDYFGVKEMVSLRDLFNARVHLGHNSGLRHDSMVPYIFGERQGIDILDLEKTLPLLHHALNFCGHIVYRGGMVLFISRHLQVLPWVEKTAKEVGEYAHCRPWKRGSFTDVSNVFGTFPIYPELCIFLNTQDTVFETHRAVTEASKLLVPSIGVVDTNCDNSLITYPIPGNDDSPDSLHLYLSLFKRIILKAKEKKKEDGIEPGADTPTIS